MSGLIDFDLETPVADWPLENDTGVDSAVGVGCGVALAFGAADADVVGKDS